MRPNWGGGAFAIVLDDGVINVGDAVSAWDCLRGQQQRVNHGRDSCARPVFGGTQAGLGCAPLPLRRIHDDG
jgi:hypothetical protein